MSCEEKETTNILLLSWEIGAHTKFSKNIYDTFKKSIYYSMYVTQFFLGSPKSFNRHRVTPEDIERSKKLLERYPLHVFSHFPYVANLAGSVKQLAWSGNTEQDAKTDFVLRELEYELNTMSNFVQEGKRSGVVIHPGNYPERLLGLSAIAHSINKITFSQGTTLVLENSAGKGCSLATTFTEIAEIIHQVLPEKQEHIGVCIDTAHLCGWGEYDLSRCSEVTRMFEDFDRIIGMDKFTLLHLNDSVVPLGSKKDHHALLGTGCIWQDSFDSLILLIHTCTNYNIPIVLETHGLDMIVLAELNKDLQGIFPV